MEMGLFWTIIISNSDLKFTERKCYLASVVFGWFIRLGYTVSKNVSAEFSETMFISYLYNLFNVYNLSDLSLKGRRLFQAHLFLPHENVLIMSRHSTCQIMKNIFAILYTELNPLMNNIIMFFFGRVNFWA